MEDLNIIKSYCLKSGVMEFQNFKLRDRAIWEGGQFYSRATYLAYAPEQIFPGNVYSRASEILDLRASRGLEP